MKQEQDICMNFRRELISTALENIQRRQMQRARGNSRLPQKDR